MLPTPAQGQIQPFAKHMGKEDPSFNTIPAEQMGSADPSFGRASNRRSIPWQSSCVWQIRQDPGVGTQGRSHP